MKSKEIVIPCNPFIFQKRKAGSCSGKTRYLVPNGAQAERRFSTAERWDQSFPSVCDCSTSERRKSTVPSTPSTEELIVRWYEAAAPHVLSV